MSTSMFVVSSVISIMVDDLTRPEVQTDVGLPVYEDPPPVVLEDGTEPALTRAEEDVALRNSTAGFPDFVAQFFRAVLVLFEALPEPGKGSRNGGKMEDVMTQTLIARRSLIIEIPLTISRFRLLAISSVTPSRLRSSTWLSTSSSTTSPPRSDPTQFGSFLNSLPASLAPIPPKRSPSSSDRVRSTSELRSSPEQVRLGRPRLKRRLNPIRLCIGGLDY